MACLWIYLVLASLCYMEEREEYGRNWTEYWKVSAWAVQSIFTFFFLVGTSDVHELVPCASTLKKIKARIIIMCVYASAKTHMRFTAHSFFFFYLFLLKYFQCC